MSAQLTKIHFTEPVVAFNDVELETARISGVMATSPADAEDTELPPEETDSSPASPEDRASRFSLWKRIFRSFATLIATRRSARPSALGAPPALPPGRSTMPRRSACERVSVEEEVMCLLWRLDCHYLRAVLRLVDHILTVRAMGNAEFVRAQVLYLLAHSRRGDVVPLLQLRCRVHGATRGALDATLLRLEAQGLLALVPCGEQSGLRERLAGIAHPTRGLLDHCALWERRAGASADTTAA